MSCDQNTKHYYDIYIYMYKHIDILGIIYIYNNNYEIYLAYAYIYMVIDLKVLVRSFNCESRACYVGNPRESFFSSSRK